ncbi:hypothetical protein [Kitasatospora purpeofusca]|uniref:hypothetical protein n=1 Tax=Kitasatospora purpeofusca TaxID=67352 RepID=UPI00365C8396
MHILKAETRALRDDDRTVPIPDTSTSPVTATRRTDLAPEAHTLEPGGPGTR